MKFYKAPWAHIEHFTSDEQITLCGVPVESGAVWDITERGSDPRIRPLCDECRRKA